MRNTLRRDQADNGVRANGNTNTTHPRRQGNEVTDRRALITELRGFAEGGTSARASLMRDAADALEAIEQQDASLRDDTANLEREKADAWSMGHDDARTFYAGGPKQPNPFRAEVR